MSYSNTKILLVKGSNPLKFTFNVNVTEAFSSNIYFKANNGDKVA